MSLSIKKDGVIKGNKKGGAILPSLLILFL